MFEKLVFLALVLILFAAVWRIESGWRIVFTPFLLAMYFELTRVFPAFLLAEEYAGIDGNYARWVAFLAYASLLAGFVAWYCIPTARPRQVLALSASRVPLRLDRLDALAALLLALVLAGLGLYFFGGLPATVQSTFSLITAGGDAELARLVSEQRFELTKGAYFGTEYKGQGVVSQVQQVGWTLICVYTLLRHLEVRTMRSLALVLAALFAAWVFVGGFGSRGPLLNMMICMLAAYSLRKALPLRAVVIAVAVGIAVAIALGLYSEKMYDLVAGTLGFGEFVAQAVTTIAERALIGNGINDVHAIEFVRNGALEVGYGAVHYRDFVSAIPGVEYGQPLAYTLYLLIDDAARGTTFRSATYLSDVFVDFYWPGVVLIFFLIGTLLSAVQKWSLRAAADPWSIAVAVSVSFAAMNSLRGGPVAFLSTLIVIATICALHKAIRLVLRELSIASASPGVGEAAGRTHG